MLYPISTKSRFLFSLDGFWGFKKEITDTSWYLHKMENPLKMCVPCSYNDMSEDIDLRNHYGDVYYQTQFSIPLIDNQLYFLRFQAVTHHATVYLNGQLLGSHKGGFLPFEFEVSKFLNEDDNLLSVVVNNVIDYTTLPVGGKGPMMSLGPTINNAKKQNYPNFDYFNYCGINRSVSIYTTPSAYIKDIDVYTTIIDNKVMLNYKIDIQGDFEPVIELFDDNILVLSQSGLEGSIGVDNAKLWSPDNPFLYKVVVKCNDDEYQLPFGMRTVEVKNNQFLINNQPFYFKGYGKHEDSFPNGRGKNLAMMHKDLSLMQYQCANAFRSSHYPYCEETLRLCDQLGIVVIDECPAVGINLAFAGGASMTSNNQITFDKEKGVQTFNHHQDVIKDMINRDKNHACVVMWSLANEPAAHENGAFEYFEPLFKLAKDIDPQKRPCTIVSEMMANGATTDCSRLLSDVICLNRYYGWYNASGDLNSAKSMLMEDLNQWRTINKPVIFTEYGADTLIGTHTNFDLMYSEEFQYKFYDMYSNVFDTYDFVIGELAWNFADFQTDQSILRVNGNKKGIFTRDRHPKMACYFFKNRWQNIPNFNYK